jgi:DNA polymerase (family 10)
MAKALPRNADLADQLDLLADISEILAEESFKIIAYRRAATRIRESPSPVAELALSGRATDLPGVGKTIEQKVIEIVEDGEIHALTRRRQRVPVGVVEFLRLPGVGPKTAARIWSELGVTTLDGLQASAEAGRLRELSGLGQKSEEKILAALAGGRAKADTGGRDCWAPGFLPSSVSCPSSPSIRLRSRSRMRGAPAAGGRPCATST